MRYLTICIFLLSVSFGLNAQSISGKIVDENKIPLPGATVSIEGTTTGSSTDMDGKFQLRLSSPGAYTLRVAFLGFQTILKDVVVEANENKSIDFVLKEDAALLDEVVVIGYGSVEKKDLTGSIVSVNSKDFQSGNVNTPEQLVLGKVAGVQITPNGGSPGSGSTIRIRGGASLNASNDPLIVIDGVPVSNDGIAGAANPLNLINPNDIENVTILKDASATAIYGSRASNGVIIITTKKAKGSDKISVEFNTVNSLSTVAKYADVFSADEFREYINATGDSNAIGRLGNANTDWQREIFRPAFSTDNIISVSGGIKALPYRVSVGFLDQNGVLITDNMKRTTANINISPEFLGGDLKVDINQKFTGSRSNFADQGAVGAAVFFDPTQPVLKDSERWGGYYEWESGDLPNNLATRNPVGLIRQRSDKSEVFRAIGNAKVDYSIPKIQGLTATVNAGYDVAQSRGTVMVDDSAASAYRPPNKGVFSEYEQYRQNLLLDLYLGYKREFKDIKSVIDVTGGYSYQDWYFESPNIRGLDGSKDTIVGTQAPIFEKSQAQNTLISFWGRINYTFNSKYLFTFTLRNDGSSRFDRDSRWGLFPSAAFAWRMNEEGFFKQFDNLSDLKLRLGYGQTGQQDVGLNFNYLPVFLEGESTAAYRFGDTWFNTLRPTVYDPSFKWETTTTYNAGLDVGFYNGRLTGAVDVFYRQTTDLIALVNIPAGINFGSRIVTNVGEVNTRGIELAINAVPVVRPNFEWSVGVNVSANRNEIVSLDRFPDPNDLGNEIGGIAGSIGDFIQINSIGQPIQSFFVLEQLYDDNGKPIEVGALKEDGTAYSELEAYVDRNNDSIINNLDRYHHKNPVPLFIFGFTSSVTYKNWSASFIARASIGNYVYNNFASNTGNQQSMISAIGVLNNGSTDALETEFVTRSDRTIRSDYFIQNASFLRMDNISIGYNFGSILNDKAYLRVFGAVQNAFIITPYSGVDPEIFGGIDNVIYPRPRIFSIGANIKI